MAGAAYKIDSKNTLALKVYKNFEKEKVRAQIGVDSQ